MPAAQGSNTNGERLARIEVKIDAILDRIVKIDQCQVDHETRLAHVEQSNAASNQMLNAVKEDVGALEKVSERWSIINGLAALGAAVLSAIGFAR